MSGLDQESASTSSVGTASSASATLNTYSCLPCRGRKKKCDRINPCANCRRLGLECHFVPRRPSTRKPASLVVLDRLRHLENTVNRMQKHFDPAVLQSLTTRQLFTEKPPTDGIESTSHSDRPNPDDDTADVGAAFGSLAMGDGRSRYVTDNFWARLNDEVEDLKSLLQSQSRDAYERDVWPGLSTSMLDHGSILGFGSALHSPPLQHPPAKQIPVYWGLFKHNCDVLIKVLHIPSIEPLVLRSAQSLDGTPRGLEALMMAVYFAVVVSLSPEQCLQLGGSKVNLLWMFKSMTEQALARAGLLETDEIITIQAFAIFLTSLRIHNSVRVMSTFTALLVRLAQNAGLHRDGTHFGLPPFVVEMRRRLWWSICVLESRACEDTGYDATIPHESVDTQLPLNVNDADLFPAMKELPQARTGITEMTFSVVRFESTKTFRHLQNVSMDSAGKNGKVTAAQTLAEKVQAIARTTERLQEVYLDYLDISDPISWYTMTICQIVSAKMSLVTYHPYLRQAGSADLLNGVKDRLFEEATTAIECWLTLNEEESTAQWRWLCETYIQWYALAFLLSELCERTQGEAVDRAWTAVDGALRLGSKIHSGSYRRSGGDVSHPPNAEEPPCESYKPLRKLLQRARSARKYVLAPPRDNTSGKERSEDFHSTPHGSPREPLPEAHKSCSVDPAFELVNPMLTVRWPSENRDFSAEWLFGNAALPDIQPGDDLSLGINGPMYPWGEDAGLGVQI